MSGSYKFRNLVKELHEPEVKIFDDLTIFEGRAVKISYLINRVFHIAKGGLQLVNELNPRHFKGFIGDERGQGKIK